MKDEKGGLLFSLKRAGLIGKTVCASVSLNRQSNCNRTKLMSLIQNSPGYNAGDGDRWWGGKKKEKRKCKWSRRRIHGTRRRQEIERGREGGGDDDENKENREVECVHQI